MLFGVSGVIILFVEMALLSGSIMPEEGWARALIAVILLLTAVFGWKFFRRLGADSLATLRGVLTKEVETNPAESAAELLDIHTERLTVSGSSTVCGQSLRALNLRARVGASVIGIEREGATHVNPTPDATLEAGDVLLVLGDNDQIERTRKLLA